MNASKLPRAFRPIKLLNESCVDGFEWCVESSNGHLVATMARKGKSKAAENQALLMAAAPDLARAVAHLLKDNTELTRATAAMALFNAGVTL